jgi:hypothetical protein
VHGGGLDRRIRIRHRWRLRMRLPDVPRLGGVEAVPVSRITVLTLAAAFLVLAWIAHAQNGVIREQANTLALYERGAASLVK